MNCRGLKSIACALVASGAIFAISVAQAASITGTMDFGGNFSATGGTDFSDATIFTLSSAKSTRIADDLLGTTVFWGTNGVINNGSFSLSSFTPVVNVLSIGGWQLDLTSMQIDEQTSGAIRLSGAGTLSGGGYDPTAASWSLVTTSGSTYGMQVTAVPVPAAVWLMGSGLLGLVGVARRKA